MDKFKGIKFLDKKTGVGYNVAFPSFSDDLIARIVMKFKDDTRYESFAVEDFTPFLKVEPQTV